MYPLIIKRLSKGYNTPDGNIEVLKNLSFEVSNGEFLSIFGPNGNGKTTLLNILGGLELDYTGDVKFFGEKPNPIKIGHVFQNFDDSLFPWMTLLSNVTFGLKMAGASKAEMTEKGKEALLKMGLEKFMKYYPYQVSGGMKQKVCIARALAVDCKLLLLDEPFSALDHDTTYKMEEDFIELWQSNPITTIFISHAIEEAVLLSDKILLLTPRPAQVLQIIDIPLKRPRNMKMIVEDDFFQIRNEIIHASRFKGDSADI